MTPTPTPLASAQLRAVTTGVSGSVGDGGSSPVTSFQAALSSRWAAMVVTAPITPTAELPQPVCVGPIGSTFHVGHSAVPKLLRCDRILFRTEEVNSSGQRSMI